MIEPGPDNDVLVKCTKDILSQIRPEEEDRNKRQSAIQELEMSIQSVATLSGAAAKPFGSFLSNLYSKSGDLDLSVQLMNSSNPPISKKKKQSILREVRKALNKRGIARSMEFIPHARVPVLQYVSNSFGISCDLSVDNYPGRIKSKVFYWISTLDERFGDMVLLIKEWAKAQNINDPKSGTLNSYSLCLLVLYHFQTCEPAILPPLKDIYEGNITEDSDMTLYDEEHLDEVCAANIAKFESKNKEQRNESSLCHLLTTFFDKFCNINAISSDVISTYTGRLEKIEDNPNRRMKKSYSLFVEDPVERPDNAARAVGIQGLLLIASALKDANLKFASLEHSDRDDLLAMLCTPAVCSKLGGRVIANSFTSTPRRTPGPRKNVGAKKSDNQRQRPQKARGITGSTPVHNPPQVYTDNTTGHQTPGQNRNRDPPQVNTDNTTGRQTPGQNRNRDPPQVHTHNTTGRQTPGQYRNHDPSQVYPDNTTGRQTPGQYRNYDPQFHTNAAGHHYQPQKQPVQYQNQYHQPSYNPGHQTAGLYLNQSHPPAYNSYVQSGVPYQNLSHPQAQNTYVQSGVPFQNNYQQVHTPGHQAAGSYSYQYHGGQQAHTNGAQTPGSYQYHQPQVWAQRPEQYQNGYQSYQQVHTPEPYQNGHHNQQQMYTAGTGVYQNPGAGAGAGARQYTPKRNTNRNNRNGVTTTSSYQPVAAGPQNVPARDSR